MNASRSRQEHHLIFSRREVGNPLQFTHGGGSLTAGPVVLLERVRELETVQHLLSDLRAGEGRALLIEGPAGIGKTALLDVARRRALEQRITVLTARGGELEGHFPFGVARQLFEPVLHVAGMEVRADLLAGAARSAESIVDARVAPQERIPEDAFAALHGLYWLTVNLSASAPLLIVVDDLHWADAGSLRFLLYLAARLDGLACAIVGAARSGEWGRAAALEARMVSDRMFDVLSPAALSEQAARELVAAGLRGDPDPAFVAAATAATGGVPFLLRELIAALAEEGVEPTAEQAVRIQRLGPHAVAQATAIRLTRMPEGCQPLAQAIAVLGGDARLPRAARLADLDESAALDALDALVAAGILRTEGRVEFVHPILRAAIYDDLAPGERSRLHRHAAHLLAGEGAPLDAVAAQLLPSEPTGSEHVIQTLRDAAAAALRRAAPEDSIAYLTRAIDEGCARELRAEILFDLGRAARLNTDPAMFGYFDEARQLTDDPALRSSAALELATALGLKGQWDHAIRLVHDALDDLGDREHDVAVRLETYLAAISASDPRLIADFERRRGMLHDLVMRGGDAARSLSLLLAADEVWRAGDESHALALVERGWDDGRVLDVGADLWSMGQAFQALVMCDRLARARDLTEVLLADARTRGSIARFVLGSAFRGWIDAREGSLTAAEGALRAAIDPVRGPQARYSLCVYLWLATEVITERPECADLADLALSVEFDEMSGGMVEAVMCDLRGRLRHIAGNTASGIEDLRRAGAIFQALGIRNPSGSSWRSALALLVSADARDEALRLAYDELDDARRFGQPRAIGVALRALGVLEGDCDLLRQAVTALQSSPSRLEYARALVELGGAMRRAGERAACRQHLRLGLDVAVEGGATRLAARARSELESSGARLRRERITGRDALTPSELRVARLAAEGRTNNEIAQALFVTPKTIDTHLSRVYSKLGISSRRAVAAALQDSIVPNAATPVEPLARR